MSRAEGTFEIKSWDENAYYEADDGRKLTRAHVTQKHVGGLDGEASVEYLMSYGDDGTAAFVVQQRFSGKVGERSGSFVLHGQGGFANGVAEAPLRIVPRSGTGELTGIAGEGNFRAKGSDTSYSLEYDFE